MAKKPKLKYQDVLDKLPNELQSIDVTDVKYHSRLRFETYEHCVQCLAVIGSEFIPNGIINGFNSRTALAMLMCNSKFNKAFKIKIYSLIYNN